MRIGYLLLVVLLAGCDNLSGNEPNERNDRQEFTGIDTPPSWAADAIWYQVLVERFRNGDPANDPTPEDIVGSYPGFIPESWQITPWTSDWYKPDPYFAEMEGRLALDGALVRGFGQKSQLRRYGGDLQGVIEKVDYIDSLGITAIYFNPLNDAASLHKFDARNWRHIDRNFGPNPLEDAAQIARENPTDPYTWTWTQADEQFLSLVTMLHERGIRVILDYSWNHTGQPFWAFQDVLHNGRQSAYADWYWIDEFDNPDTPENEFDFKGWIGIKELPEIRETIFHDHRDGTRAYEGDIYSQDVKEHIFEVTRRWLDPNNDGDPSDGVDGFRLDVAAEIGLDFWREYRRVVRESNPEAYLVGEVWWESWPDKLLDPDPFLQGDVFDAVMNYRWFRSARHFFAQAPDEMPVSEFVDSLKAYDVGLGQQQRRAMMNVAASHDTPRVSTSLFNRNAYKFNASPSADPNYRINQPDTCTYETLGLLMAHQFTYVGAPHIWAGDEMGMWGADDPSTRKPLIWPDYDFENETAHPDGRTRSPDTVRFDYGLFDRYRTFIRIRQEYPVLARGELEYVVVDDASRLLVFRRFDEDTEVFALFNVDDRPHTVELTVLYTSYRDVLNDLVVVKLSPERVSISLPPRRSAIVVHEGR